MHSRFCFNGIQIMDKIFIGPSTNQHKCIKYTHLIRFLSELFSAQRYTIRKYRSIQNIAENPRQHNDAVSLHLHRHAHQDLTFRYLLQFHTLERRANTPKISAHARPSNVLITCAKRASVRVYFRVCYEMTSQL